MLEAAPGYEFTEAQNERLQLLYRRTRFLGYVLLLAGSLVLASGLTVTVHLAFSTVAEVLAGSTLILAAGGPVLILMGLLLLRAVNAFRAIVDTAGQDIDHLMVALDELQKFFSFSSGLGLLVIMALVALMVNLILNSGGSQAF